MRWKRKTSNAPSAEQGIRAPTRLTALGSLAALLPLLAGPAPSQELSLQVRLAADAEGAGPPAWRMLREEFLPKLPGWPRGCDPAGALRLEIELPYALRVTPLTANAAGSTQSSTEYFEAHLHMPGNTLLAGTCDFTGREIWRGVVDSNPDAAASLHHTIRRLTAQPKGEIAIDASRWLAQVAKGRGILVDFTRRLATQMETWHANVSTDAGQLVIASPAGGSGVLLPLVLARVAAGSSSGRLGPVPPIDEATQWRLLAAAAVGASRTAAVRQLIRFPGTATQRTLEALLANRDGSRIAAMESLAAIGAVDSRHKILAAGTPRIPGSTTVAEASAALLARDTRPPRRSQPPTQPQHSAQEPEPVLAEPGSPSWIFLLSVLSVIATLGAVIGWDCRAGRPR